MEDNTKYCKYCGHQIDDNSAYCSKCGKNLDSIRYKRNNELKKSGIKILLLLFGIFMFFFIFHIVCNLIINPILNKEANKEVDYSKLIYSHQITDDTLLKLLDSARFCMIDGILI